MAQQVYSHLICTAADPLKKLLAAALVWQCLYSWRIWAVFVIPFYSIESFRKEGYLSSAVEGQAFLNF